MTLSSISPHSLSARHPHRLNQIVDRAGRHALDVGLLDHRSQRLLGHPPRLQEAGEVAPLPQLRDLQLDRAGPGLPGPVAVAVALIYDAAGADDILELTVGDLSLLARKTGYLDQTNGLVVLLRHVAANTRWSHDDKALLHAAARQLGIALRQAADTAELQRLSRTDGLTGLLNRRAFVAELKASIGRAERERRAGALLYIDLDNFKPVNDRFDHDRGDAILQAVSAILRDHARSYDLVARLGGDEFVVWLDGVETSQAAKRGAELVEAVALAGRDILPPDCQIGASVGIVNLPPGGGVSADDLLTRGDHAMYQTKSERKAKRAQTREVQR